MSSALTAKKPNKAKDLGKSNEFKDIKQPSKTKKIVKIAVIFTVVIATLGGIAAVLVFNALNIRDAHLRPLIEPIPWLGDLLPPLDYYGEAVVPPTIAELEAQVLQMQTTIEILEMDNEQLNSLVNSQAVDINNMSASITTFEAQHETFQQNQAEFYRIVAEGAPQEFIQFFETMNPEIAASIFEELVGDQITQAQVQEYVSLFLELSTRNAADVLQEMIGGQLPLVISILEATPLGPRGTLINAMSLENRTIVMTMLAQDIEF